MSHNDYNTRANRRTGGYAAYDASRDRDRDHEERSRGDPYASRAPIPTISAADAYDTYRPPALHGRTSASAYDTYRPSRPSGGPYDSRRPSPASAYDTYVPGRDRPTSSGSAYDTYRPNRAPPRANAYDTYRPGGGREPPRGSAYDTYRPRGREVVRPAENDYSAYETYRPPVKPTDEYARKLERYAGVVVPPPTRERPRGRERSLERRDEKKRYDTSDSDEEDSEEDDRKKVRRQKAKAKNKAARKKRGKKNKKKKDDTSEESDSESQSDEETDDDEATTEESDSESDDKKKRKSKKSSKQKKSSRAKKRKEKKKKKKRDTDTDYTESSEEDSSEEETVNKVTNATSKAVVPVDPATLGASAFGTDVNTFPDLMGGSELNPENGAVVSAADFANMPGEMPEAQTPALSLAGRFPQLGAAVSTPFGPGVMTAQGMAPQMGMGGAVSGMGTSMPGMGAGMQGMGQGMGQGVVGMQQGMGMVPPLGNQMGFDKQVVPGAAMGGAGTQGMQPGIGAQGGTVVPQGGMGQAGVPMQGGQPDLMTPFAGMNLGGDQNAF